LEIFLYKYFIHNTVPFTNRWYQKIKAIAFLTGDQAKIPNFIDKLYLGWLFRIIFNPRLYFLRYFNSFKLLFMVNNSKVKLYEKK